MDEETNAGSLLPISKVLLQSSSNSPNSIRCGYFRILCAKCVQIIICLLSMMTLISAVILGYHCRSLIESNDFVCDFPNKQRLIWGYTLGGLMEMSTAQRTFKKLHSQLSQGKFSKNSSLFLRANAMEKSQYPWLKGTTSNSLMENADYNEGRAIVVVYDRKDVPFVVNLAENLYLLNTTLSVMGYYFGEKKLPKDIQSRLASRGLPTIVLEDVLDTRTINIDSYSAKPFATLMAPYREVIAVDPDVLFLRDPAILFDHPLYKLHGSLWFKSLRTSLSQKRRDFLEQILPKPHSDAVKVTGLYSNDVGLAAEGLSVLRLLIEEAPSPFLDHTNFVVFSASVVVLDKKERFHSLLATCKLLSNPIRGIALSEAIQAKQEWWLGAGIVGDAFTFNDRLPGVIAEIRRVNKDGSEEICGKTLHLGADGQPMFMKGGFVEMESENRTRFINLSYWSDNTAYYDIRSSDCIAGKSQNFDDTTKDWLEKLRQHWQSFDKYQSERVGRGFND